MTENTKRAFAQAPRNILFARNLTSVQKIVLFQMIDRRNYLQSQGKLGSDGYFYMTGRDFERQTDLTANYIRRSILPELEKMGFFIKKRYNDVKDDEFKTYSYFLLNDQAIFAFDGTQKVPVEKQRKTKPKEKAKKKQLEVSKTLLGVMGFESVEEILEKPSSRKSYDSEGGQKYINDRAKRVAFNQSGLVSVSECESLYAEAMDVAKVLFKDRAESLLTDLVNDYVDMIHRFEPSEKAEDDMFAHMSLDD